MKTIKIWGGVQEIFKISIVTPSLPLYTKIEQFLHTTHKRKLAQIDLIDGSVSDAASRIRKSIQAGRDAVILWEPMASAMAAAYPQQRIFVVQPSVLDLLNCIRQVPEGKSCGVIIPFSLRDYYDDLELQLKAMEIPFYRLISDTDERALRAAVHQAALAGIQWLVGSAGSERYVRAEGMEYIPLQPEWGGLVRAFFKVLWSLRQSRLSQRRTLSSPKGVTAYYHLDDIIGRSPMMKQVKSLARIYAASESTILITGESGTGKEMLAQAIHNMSSRRQGPFLALNCSAVSESLLESELFGYTGGAFTGARREGREGLFEAANGGTLFLDEIGDMPYDLQNYLLRVLQERCIRRLGSHQSIPIDVRIIAATNKNLEQAVREHHFRMDLYYRLAVLLIHVPPLRHRRADIAVVSQALLRRFNAQYGRHHELGQDVIDYFQTLPWPGNVRQLANTIERLTLVVSRKKITLPDLAWVMPNPPVIPDKRDRDRNLKDMTYEYIEKMYQEGKSVSEIAKELGISRSTIYRMRQKYRRKKEL
ncbi:sigma 54-interacting transcriptional regulator [Megasphaera sp.]|uniref:sigma 54-interacting transcriptional regulator n=1 Tax=Megasphaera sp. TaxID=2023260 RepID=UPI0025B982AA|nr:sigma 54-interacting transcriptional regulator [Megasphaera sp.]